MLISRKWIERIISSATGAPWSVSDEELDAGFVRVGFETEGYEAIPETSGPLVIGRVEQIEELTGFKKPIRFCQVNVGNANGTGELQGIICGARNFREGSTVVVSLPGAVLPGGFKIAARETYGHISQGMICSAAELGFTDKQNSGIITLPEGSARPGEDARAILGLGDTVFDVNVTPDRGYALSARGLAREICSAFDLEFIDPAQEPQIADVELDVPAASGTLMDVNIHPATKTLRFGLRKVSGIDPSVESPWWLQRELMLCGARPVNAATDVTNYVMFLLGQPMHAFDAAQINGGLTVRLADEGEKFTTLDHVDRTLGTGDVVICDETGIQSLAGVMGGTTSEISEETTDVYFEAACWDPITVARTSRKHKLSSEASRRFERGVDPALVEVALDLAASLLAQIAGGTVQPRISVIGQVPEMTAIEISAGRPGRVAGIEYSTETVVSRLQEVGCAVSQVETDGEYPDLVVTPPTWRTDLTMSADLVEEVLRLEGLEDIPAVLPTPRGGRGLSWRQRRRRVIGHTLAHNGYTEILPTPFMAAEVLDIWGLEQSDPRRDLVTVNNPLEADHAVLATTLLPAMLEAVARNVARGQQNLSLFGQQQVSYHRSDFSPMLDVSARPADSDVEQLLGSLPDQPLYVATVGCGRREPEGPWGSGRDYDYADAVESARMISRSCGLKLEVRKGEKLPWHPGRCAELVVVDTDGETVVGHAGELHPQILRAMGLPSRVCAMELNASALPKSLYLPAPVLSSFPALHQDIAVVVDEDIPAAQVQEVLKKGAGELLEKIELFDVFRGAQLGDNKKSLAYSLVFRAPDRTLTDEEANESRLAAAEAAKRKCGAEMRA